MSESEDYQYLNQSIICADEVGRGPLAGPVVACAIGGRVTKDLLQLLKNFQVTDSKKLNDKKRQKIINELEIDLDVQKTNQWRDLFFYIEEIDSNEIDKINIFQASMKAMKNSCLQIIPVMNEVNHIFIDGKFPIEFEDRISKAVIKGDSRFLLMGLASIIAKVYRDELMKKYSIIYPGYGFEKHAGYPTKKHKEAIDNLGITPIHRRSFRGVKEYVL